MPLSPEESHSLKRAVFERAVDVAAFGPCGVVPEDQLESLWEHFKKLPFPTDGAPLAGWCHWVQKSKLGTWHACTGRTAIPPFPNVPQVKPTKRPRVRPAARFMGAK